LPRAMHSSPNATLAACCGSRIEAGSAR
jgi:hypothetical protein